MAYSVTNHLVRSFLDKHLFRVQSYITRRVLCNKAFLSMDKNILLLQVNNFEVTEIIMKQSKPEIGTNKTSSQPKQLGAKAVKPSTGIGAKSSTKSGSTTKTSGGLGKTAGGISAAGAPPVRGQSSGSIGGSTRGTSGGTSGGTVKQTGSLGSGTTGGKGNSISFGAVNFDSQLNLLKVRTTQGNSQILCCITGDALRECFHAGTSAQDLEKTFHQHEKEIQYCAQQKIQNKQWKIPNQEILLNTQDLRQYTK